MTGWWWALLAGFVFVVIYPYGIYPALIACWACWARLVRRPHLRGPYTGTVSLILVVRNEARALPHRLRELSIQLASCGPGGELIVVSDGSTDDTAGVAHAGETEPGDL